MQPDQACPLLLTCAIEGSLLKLFRTFSEWLPVKRGF